jgi:hypothetical protein
MARRNILSSSDVTNIFMDLPTDGEVGDDPDFDGFEGGVDDSEDGSDTPCQYIVVVVDNTIIDGRWGVALF